MKGLLGTDLFAQNKCVPSYGETIALTRERLVQFHPVDGVGGGGGITGLSSLQVQTTIKFRISYINPADLGVHNASNG